VLAQLSRACEARDRDPRALDISVFAAPSDKAALEHLAALGVTRVITMLPTADLDESLAVLDAQAAFVEWARTL
jgi:hypothetical protein